LRGQRCRSFTALWRREVALKLNMSWHHPDLYFFLCLFAGLAAFLAIIYECIQKFRRRKPVYLKKAKPLDGLRRDRPLPTALNKLRNRFRRRFTPGEVQRLGQRSHTRL
jgi:hypothetical protein